MTAVVPAPIAAFLAAYDAQDADAVRACCAPGLYFEDPLSGGPLESADALVEHLATAWGAFPDGRLESTGRILTDGAYLAAPVKLVATHRGALGPIPATDRFLIAHAVLYVELDEARTRLWRMRAFYDAYGAAIQLGALPKAGSAGQRALMVLQGFGINRS